MFVGIITAQKPGFSKSRASFQTGIAVEVLSTNIAARAYGIQFSVAGNCDSRVALKKPS
jgi:hypothetical protein